MSPHARRGVTSQSTAPFPATSCPGTDIAASDTSGRIPGRLYCPKMRSPHRTLQSQVRPHPALCAPRYHSITTAYFVSSTIWMDGEDRLVMIGEGIRYTRGPRPNTFYHAAHKSYASPHVLMTPVSRWARRHFPATPRAGLSPITSHGRLNSHRQKNREFRFSDPENVGVDIHTRRRRLSAVYLQDPLFATPPISDDMPFFKITREPFSQQGPVLLDVSAGPLIPLRLAYHPRAPSVPLLTVLRAQRIVSDYCGRWSRRIPLHRAPGRFAAPLRGTIGLSPRRGVNALGIVPPNMLPFADVGVECAPHDYTDIDALALAVALDGGEGKHEPPLLQRSGVFGAKGESGAVVDSVGGVIVRVAQGKVCRCHPLFFHVMTTIAVIASIGCFELGPSKTSTASSSPRKLQDPLGVCRRVLIDCIFGGISTCRPPDCFAHHRLRVL
ncbi:hypothetical protein C8J57DRAFT_1666076 [Mycena rebaudengoi]|nr:hypothetical protein C8J57DRAFT_1666076 [Mycena rebaudengoi]